MENFWPSKSGRLVLVPGAELLPRYSKARPPKTKKPPNWAWKQKSFHHLPTTKTNVGEFNKKTWGCWKQQWFPQVAAMIFLRSLAGPSISKQPCKSKSTSWERYNACNNCNLLKKQATLFGSRNILLVHCLLEKLPGLKLSSNSRAWN